MSRHNKWKTDEDQLHRLPGDYPVNEDAFGEAAVEADFWQREGEFKLKADWEPGGDQPTAIASLVDGLQRGLKHQVLLGATGTGKTQTYFILT